MSDGPRRILAVDVDEGDASADGIIADDIGDNELAGQGMAHQRFDVFDDVTEVLDALANRNGPTRAAVEGEAGGG